MNTTRPLEFGACLPRWDPYATPDGWRRIARTAEESGYDWIGRGDRVVFPAREDDEAYSSRPAAETFSVLSYVAAETTDVRIGTNICVAPYRHPVYLAKLALTLDTLSDGRFELGVGAGWMRDEFEALDVPYEERGARIDEFLELFEQVRETGELSFDGPVHSFETIGFHPRPRRSGGPPIWLGGNAGPTFRRVGQYGAGWAISGKSPEVIASGAERAGNAWTDFGREGEPQIAATCHAYLTDRETNGDDPLVGTPEQVIEGIETYQEAGVTRFVLSLDKNANGDTMDVDERVEQLERFATEVAPAFGDD